MANVLALMQPYGVDPALCWQALQERGRVVNNRRSVTEATYYELLANIADLPDLLILAEKLLALQQKIDQNQLAETQGQEQATRLLNQAFQEGIGGFSDHSSIQSLEHASIIDLLVDALNALVLSSSFRFCST